MVRIALAVVLSLSFNASWAQQTLVPPGIVVATEPGTPQKIFPDVLPSTSTAQCAPGYSQIQMPKNVYVCMKTSLLPQQ